MRSSLEIWDIAQGRARVVLQCAERIEAPNWSPCGRYLLVNGDGKLFRVPLAAPRLEPVDTGGITRLNNDHGISPDGQHWVISAHHRGKGAEIWMLPAGGGKARLISPLAPSWWHGWSPDGRSLTYAAVRNASRIIDIYVQDLASGAERRLTHAEGQHDGPDFSADGQRIYFNCDRDGHAQIWVMNADGCGQRRLFSDACVNWFPHPSPCGRYLIWLSYPEGTKGHPADVLVSIWIGTPDGGSRRRLTRFIGGQGTMNVPNWAPDGSGFAYMRYGPFVEEET